MTPTPIGCPARPGPPTPRAPRARRDHRLERVDVAHLVAEGDHASRPMPRDEALDGLTLAAGVLRPKIDDRPTAVVGEPVDQALAALDGLDRRDDGRPGRRDVVGLADVECDRWTLALHEQPSGVAEFCRDAAREDLGGVAMDVVRGVGHRDQAFSARATSQDAVLQAVIAEVLHATDPHPGRDVGDDPAGQDRHVQPLGALASRCRPAFARHAAPAARSGRRPGRATRPRACRRNRR